MSAVLEGAAIERVKNAIETILSLNSTQQQRRSAHELIESVKSESPHAATIGLALYRNDGNEIQVRHVGLQFMQDYIKQKWNSITTEEKAIWKKEAMFLIETTRLTETGHIKEGIVRVLVEILKREFPQNWPNFLPELAALQAKGIIQLELSLLVLLRLAEDVILSLDPHIHTQRRRNIEQALSENMRDLFTFFIKTLQDNVGSWRRNKGPMNLRLAEATLFTLSAYIGHASMEHIFASNAVILQMLCQLLDDTKLRMAAADCLLVLLERRRDRVDQRMQMILLFSDDAMSLFCEVARKAFDGGADEDQYSFFKKICEIMIALGVSQLADIWGHERGISKRPDTFDKYLKLILDLMNHPSQFVSLRASSVCIAFLKHKQISKDDVFIDSIPFFVSAAAEKLAKVGGPDDESHPSSAYSAIDHESQCDFLEFFGKLRAMLCGCLRDCTSILPVHCFEYVCHRVMETVQKPNDLILWETLATLLETVLNRFWRVEKVEEASDIIVERGKTVNITATSNEVIQSLIQFRTNIPQVDANVLLGLQPFFPFFKRSQTHLMAAVEKIMLTFTDYPLDHSNKDVVTARRQATACFVNLCKQDSAHLLPFFDAFKNFVAKLGEDGVISTQEFHTLTEGLILLSNGMPTEKRQEFLLMQVSKIEGFVSNTELKSSLETTEKFVKFVGFTDTDWNGAIYAENRGQLHSFFGLLMALVRRTELTEAEKTMISSGGGFFGITVESAWLQKTVNLLPMITAMIKHIGAAWSSQIRCQIHSSYMSAFTLAENDRAFLLGHHVAKEIKEAQSISSSVAIKASLFLYMLHIQSYTLLGQVGGLLEDLFYKYEGLTALIINDVMSSWVFLPKYRFVTVFKTFLKPFISHCPPSCFVNVVRPIMSVLLESMLQLLSEEWLDYQEKTSQSEIGKKEDDVNENPSDQVIEERLIYSLSREYIEALVSIFFEKRREKDLSTSNEETPHDPGEIGKFILECDATNSHFIFTMFTVLTWPDTVSANKAVRVLPHIINFITQKTASAQKIDPSVINQLFLCMLKGLQAHGVEMSVQGGLISSALHAYVNLRVAYPSIVQVMLMVPSCTKEQLMKFDLDVFETECKLTEKKKREHFRKFLSDAFGKNVSEIYNADIKIKDLPPLAPRTKTKPESNENFDSICNLFGKDS